MIYHTITCLILSPVLESLWLVSNLPCHAITWLSFVVAGACDLLRHGDVPARVINMMV